MSWYHPVSLVIGEFYLTETCAWLIIIILQFSYHNIPIADGEFVTLHRFIASLLHSSGYERLAPRHWENEQKIYQIKISDPC